MIEYIYKLFKKYNYITNSEGTQKFEYEISFDGFGKILGLFDSITNSYTVRSFISDFDYRENVKNADISLWRNSTQFFDLYEATKEVIIKLSNRCQYIDTLMPAYIKFVSKEPNCDYNVDFSQAEYIDGKDEIEYPLENLVLSKVNPNMNLDEHINNYIDEIKLSEDPRLNINNFIDNLSYLIKYIEP